jgi:hypothetical protein
MRYQGKILAGTGVMTSILPRRYVIRPDDGGEDKL